MCVCVCLRVRARDHLLEEGQSQVYIQGKMKAWNLETSLVANRDAEDNRDKEGVELCSALTPLGVMSEWGYLH